MDLLSVGGIVVGGPFPAEGVSLHGGPYSLHSPKILDA
jgi:hypothetical protein